jgi:hypothetical protein
MPGPGEADAIQRHATISRNERARTAPGSSFHWAFGTVMIVPEYQMGKEPKMAWAVPGGWRASIGHNFKVGRTIFPFLAPIG